MDKQLYSSFRSEQLQDPDVKREYEEQENEFALAREILELRRQRNITQKELVSPMDTSWLAIARRRLDEVRSGTVETVPGEPVFDRLRKRFEG